MPYYHGSPTKNLKILKPHYDKRLNIKAVFFSDEPYSPMRFALLKQRHTSSVNLTTKKGKFVSGKVLTQYPLLKEGYLYTLKVNLKDLKKRPRLHTKIPLKVIHVKKITKKDVLGLGWKVIVKK